MPPTRDSMVASILGDIKRALALQSNLQIYENTKLRVRVDGIRRHIYLSELSSQPNVIYLGVVSAEICGKMEG